MKHEKNMPVSTVRLPTVGDGSVDITYAVGEDVPYDGATIKGQIVHFNYKGGIPGSAKWVGNPSNYMTEKALAITDKPLS